MVDSFHSTRFASLLAFQRSLTQMNLQIHHVIDDITGLTGLAIVDAILAGQRDPVELAKLRNWRIKADPRSGGAVSVPWLRAYRE